jgi:hypothetical protein
MRKLYPRWSKPSTLYEVYQPFKGWHGGSVYNDRRNHPEGDFLATVKDHSERFQSLEEAKNFVEALYEMENARQKFEFPIQPIDRAAKGRQKVVLHCPIMNGVPRHGWLSINWGPKLARVQWDYGGFDACYPECERFNQILEQSNWDRELIRRLIEAGWAWQLIDRTCMRWNQVRGVPHELAQWILDTLPGVYSQACRQFAETGLTLKVEM